MSRVEAQYEVGNKIGGLPDLGKSLKEENVIIKK